LPDTVAKSRLHGADVLLYRGTGWVAEIIRFFDGTDFSHVGLYLGREAVGEALGNGLVQTALVQSITGRKRVLVRRLKQDVTLQPVLDRAQIYIAQGPRYAYEQILLLAFLTLTRKLPVAVSLRALLRSILDRAAQIVTGIVALGKDPMICSEFVFRCYDEAVPEAADLYSLEIPVFRAGAIPPRPGVRAAARLGAGAGLHPESLLAWRLSYAPGLRRGPAATRRRAAARAVRPADLDRAIQVYLAEVRGEARPRGRAEEVSDADLAAAVDRYALAFESRRGRVARREAVAAARALLTDVVPDFVTPGDLLHTPSLFSVGDLALR
jgi:hypothetical protein